MTPIIDARAQQIQAHHDAAHAAADKAIEHAKEAGRLLLEVKASLPHGDFSKWVSEHLTVGQRQAQRYMAAAEGRTPRLPGKSDTVSYLVAPSAADAFKPLLVIPPGTMVQVTKEIAGSWKDEFFVLPSESGDGLFTYAHFNGPVSGGGHVVWSDRPCTEQGIQIAFFMHMNSLDGASIKYTKREAMPDDFWRAMLDSIEE